MFSGTVGLITRNECQATIGASLIVSRVKIERMGAVNIPARKRSNHRPAKV